MTGSAGTVERQNDNTPVAVLSSAKSLLRITMSKRFWLSKNALVTLIPIRFSGSLLDPSTPMGAKTLSEEYATAGAQTLEDAAQRQLDGEIRPPLEHVIHAMRSSQQIIPSSYSDDRSMTADYVSVRWELEVEDSQAE